MKLRALVADDSILYRRVISEVLASLPDVEVVGTANNGKLAVQKVNELRPDLLTLDMEMPEMDGLAVLEALRKSGGNTSTIVVSALTQAGGRLTLRAMEIGAFDFITKPEFPSAEQSRDTIRRELAPRVRALATRAEVRTLLRGNNALAPTHALANGKPVLPKARNTVLEPPPAPERIPAFYKPEMVLIGVSTGGPNALARLLPALSNDLGVPILIVQHMPPIFTQSLAESLSSKCSLKVCEAKDGDVVVPNTVYIAPGGRQMKLAPGPDGGKLLRITDDPPENNCRPAVDYLFRSAATQFPGRSLAVILTGMGSDGTLGLRLLKRHGCFVIAQNEASCVVYGMPKAAVEAGVTDSILPLDGIAQKVSVLVRGARK